MSDATPAGQVRSLSFNEMNYYCIDCGSTKGERFVNLALKVFVCGQCAEGHRDLGHTVKSVAEDGWSSNQVKELKLRGNASMLARISSIEYKSFKMPPELAQRREIIVKKYTELRKQEIEAQIRREEYQRLKENLKTNNNTKMIHNLFPELSKMHMALLPPEEDRANARVDATQTLAPIRQFCAPTGEPIEVTLAVAEAAPELIVNLPDKMSEQVEKVEIEPRKPLLHDRMRRNTFSGMRDETAPKPVEKKAPGSPVALGRSENGGTGMFPKIVPRRTITWAELMELDAGMKSVLSPQPTWPTANRRHSRPTFFRD